MGGLLTFLSEAAGFIHSLSHLRRSDAVVFIGHSISAHTGDLKLVRSKLVSNFESAGALGESGPVFAVFAH